MRLRSALLGASALAAFAVPAMAERGADGHVNIIYWQAPSILNPYLSSGTKDVESGSMILEPLAGFDETGELYARLAEEVPTIENGGFAEDLKSITWKLKEGLLWSDGTPVTSEDVVFTAEYCMHPEGGCAQLARYEGIESVEAVDERTITVTYKEPRPNPYTAFVGATSPILQKAQFQDCLGAKAPECTEANFGPIGTGPFVVTEFKPNDVISMEANPNYRDPAKPAFATVTFKGGGDATGAARAVFETGEFDYAWNLQLAPDVIAKMEAGGKGKAITGFGPLVERIEVNLTDPSPSLDADTRSTRKAPHPFLTDVNVRKALSMAIDRELLVEVGYGKAGKPTCDLVPVPDNYAAKNDFCFKQDIEGANKLLDEAGWVKGADGVRAKDGVRLSIVYATSTNAVRQDFQALIKDWWNEIGFEVELRNASASVFFGGDPGSPDTFQKFYADVEMYANTFNGTDPQQYLAAYRCGGEPKPESQWQGENINRYCDPAYDALIDELARTGDIAKRGEIAIKMNNMLTKDSHTIIGLVHRGRVSGQSNTLGGHVLNVWDSELWDAAEWYRKQGS